MGKLEMDGALQLLRAHSSHLLMFKQSQEALKSNTPCGNLGMKLSNYHCTGQRNQ